MIDRLHQVLSDAVDEGHYYRWVTMLGGIHDLGLNPNLFLMV
jgi:hypothetical protein